MTAPVNNGSKTMEPARKDTRFKPGNGGRPKGSKNKRTVLLEAITESDLEAIRNKLIEKAKEGDTQAARLIYDRIEPVPRARRVQIVLPDTSTMDGISKAMAAIVAAMAAGQIDPTEAQQIGALLESNRRIIETVDLAARIAALEAKAN